MKVENNNLDNTLKDTFKGIGLEKPSISFLDTVMSEVVLASKKETVKPLISRRWWIGIAATITVLVITAFFNTTEESSLFGYIPFDTIKYPEIQFPSLELSNSFTISSGVSYGIMLAALLLLVQVFFLKNRLDKSIDGR